MGVLTSLCVGSGCVGVRETKVSRGLDSVSGGMGGLVGGWVGGRASESACTANVAAYERREVYLEEAMDNIASHQSG